MLKKKIIGFGLGLVGYLVGAVGQVAAQAPPPKPPVAPAQEDAVTYVQIVNTTSVPTIALSVNGKKDYPVFNQGSYTADGPVRRLNVKYSAENSATGAVAQSTDLKFRPNQHQTVVIVGDFNTDTPPGELPQPGPPPPKPEKPFPPNVLFLTFFHEKQEGPRIALRVINGMPGKELSFKTKTGKLTIEPGKDEVLPDQVAVCQYSAEVEGTPIEFLMRQDGSQVRNAMVIFYLVNGVPTIKRAFEN